MSIRPVEDRKIPVASGYLFPDLINHIQGLIMFVFGMIHHDRLTRWVLRPEEFFRSVEVVADHTACRLEDRLGRSVVLLEFDDLGSGEVFLEVQYVRDVGTAPSVNGLIVIPHNTDVPMGFNQKLDQFILDGVGVLKLINHHVAQQVPIGLQHLWKAAKEKNCQSEEVSEVEGVVPSQRLLICCIYGGHPLVK